MLKKGRPYFRNCRTQGFFVIIVSPGPKVSLLVPKLNSWFQSQSPAPKVNLLVPQLVFWSPCWSPGTLAGPLVSPLVTQFVSWSLNQSPGPLVSPLVPQLVSWSLRLSPGPLVSLLVPQLVPWSLSQSHGPLVSLLVPQLVSWSLSQSPGPLVSPLVPQLVSWSLRLSPDPLVSLLVPRSLGPLFASLIATWFLSHSSQFLQFLGLLQFSSFLAPWSFSFPGSLVPIVLSTQSHSLLFSLFKLFEIIRIKKSYLVFLGKARLPAKDETVKTTSNSLNVTIPRLNQVFSAFNGVVLWLK